MARYTLGEIEAQCRKAARGAGCSWGMAEEAGRSVRWLSSHGLAGPKALAALLSGPRNCPCAGGDGAVCGLRFAAHVSDCAAAIAAGRLMSGNVAQPLLVLAALGQAAEALRTGFALEWPEGRTVCAPDGVWLPENLPERAEIRCMGTEIEVPNMRPSPSPMSVDEADWLVLSALAARTYAPATEASRELGAGGDG